MDMPRTLGGSFDLVGTRAFFLSQKQIEVHHSSALFYANISVRFFGST